MTEEQQTYFKRGKANMFVSGSSVACTLFLALAHTPMLLITLGFAVMNYYVAQSCFDKALGEDGE